MKKLISLFSALAFLLAFTGSVFAQSNVSASTELVKSLSFTKNSELKFGQILTTESNDVTVDANGSETRAGGTAVEGEIKVTGSDTASVTISFTNPSNLTDASSNTITFTPNIAGNTTDNKSGASELNTGTSNTETLSSSGVYFIYYGGTLNGGDISSASPAYFSGSITTSVSYE